MTIEETIQSRSGNICELCAGTEQLAVYIVPPSLGTNADQGIYACSTCSTQIEDPSSTEPNHWRCLNEAMWSTVPAVQVVAWRMLRRLRSEGWPQDLLDMLYLDDETKAWAREGQPHEDAAPTGVHQDSNGVPLEAGDTVVLIKDLKVKGANFIAKRGTAVRRISLVADNPGQIEGRVNDQQIVILTEYVKKSK